MNTRPFILPSGYWAGRNDPRGQNNVHLRHDWAEPLALWIADYFSDRKDLPVYDFGCGMGSYVNVLDQHGYDVMGYEGDPLNHAHTDKVTAQDITVPFTVPKPGNVVCLEVAEHIPPELTDAFLTNIIAACSNKLVTSWSMYPGGDGHVNCMENGPAIEHFTQRGMTYLPDDTQSARDAVKGHRLWYFTETLLIFKH